MRYHVFYSGHATWAVHDANHQPVRGQRSARVFRTPDGAEKAARRMPDFTGLDAAINPFVENPDAATKACAAAAGYQLTDE